MSKIDPEHANDREGGEKLIWMMSDTESELPGQVRP